MAFQAWNTKSTFTINRSDAADGDNVSYASWTGVKTTITVSSLNDSITFNCARSGGAYGAFGTVLFDFPTSGTYGAIGGFQVTSQGVQVGSPTGGNKGSGTINVAADVYKNNTAYTNPDYVLELWDTGKIEKFAENPGAKGYTLISIDECEKVMRETHKLPRMSKDASGLFERGDFLLEKIEEAFIYIIELKKEIEQLKKEKR